LGVEDLFGVFLPGEGLGVAVPGGDPGADIAFEGLQAFVDPAADQLVWSEIWQPNRHGTRRTPAGNAEFD